MTRQGKVGPDHAAEEAALRLFQTGAATHELSQKVVAEGPGHRLFVATPKGPAPARGWPVLYMLDGNAAFDFLTPGDLAMAPGLAIVGIGYFIICYPLIWLSRRMEGRSQAPIL